MTKEEFVTMQLHHQESGKTLKEYLKEMGVGYSTYNYWRKKFLSDEELRDLAPISFRAEAHQATEALPYSFGLGGMMMPMVSIYRFLGNGTAPAEEWGRKGGF